MQALFLSIIKLIQFFFAVNQYWAFSHIKQGFLPFSDFINLLRMRLIHAISGSFFCQFLSIPDKRDRNHSVAVAFQHSYLSFDLSGFKSQKPHQYFSNLFNASTKGLNKTYGRHGSLFERPFKRKEITGCIPSFVTRGWLSVVCNDIAFITFFKKCFEYELQTQNHKPLDANKGERILTQCNMMCTNHHL